MVDDSWEYECRIERCCQKIHPADAASTMHQRAKAINNQIWCVLPEATANPCQTSASHEPARLKKICGKGRACIGVSCRNQNCKIFLTFLETEDQTVVSLNSLPVEWDILHIMDLAFSWGQSEKFHASVRYEDDCEPLTCWVDYHVNARACMRIIAIISSSSLASCSARSSWSKLKAWSLNRV